MGKNKIYRRKIRKRRRILRFFLSILLSISLYLFTFKTGFFNIKDIQVVGNHKMDYNKIVKASMCTIGENTFKINKKTGEKSLDRLSYVKNSRIRRKLPNTIIIEIEERTEMAIIPHIGSFVYIDDEGYILSIEEKNTDTKLPQVFGVELTEFNIGENLFEQLENTNLENFTILSKQIGLLSSMKYINLSDTNNIRVELNDGIKVIFGSIDNIQYKLSFLSEIQKDIKKKDINVKQISFNKGDNPVIVMGDK